MFIAFEGPDNTGKSTSALALDCAANPDYNATREMHLRNVADWNGDAGTDPMPHTYDRIDWMTHMVYRLAMPDRHWNDERPRTVFAMPDTHLVFRLHEPSSVASTDPEEGYGMGEPAKANQMYYYFADYFLNLNRVLGYTLFKSVSIVEVVNSQGSFSQRLVDHDSPAADNTDRHLLMRLVDSDYALLEFLHHVNHHIG